jgi:HD-GYP domain-containing protein (c-di-GMP phosphodiesterase class II)
VADVYESLTSDRPYRAAMSDAEALTILEKDRAVAFDADVLDALITVLGAFDAGSGEDLSRAA